MSKDLASMFELPKEHFAELFGRTELHLGPVCSFWRLRVFIFSSHL